VRAPVYFVRHGQSEWNLRRLTQGQTRHPQLTALGREQAACAAEAIAADLALRVFPGARLVSSDLLRAVETAQIVGKRIGLVPELDARLREQHLGELEGCSYEESLARAELHDWSNPDLPLAGGESAGQVRRRMAAVVAELDLNTPTILISHGDAIRSVLAHLMGRSLATTPWIDVHNGAVAWYDSGDIGWLPQRVP
jgi:probable phosphoglycerate mutase